MIEGIQALRAALALPDDPARTDAIEEALEDLETEADCAQESWQLWKEAAEEARRQLQMEKEFSAQLWAGNQRMTSKLERIGRIIDEISI